MLILELITSLILWIMILIPMNSYIMDLNERSSYKLIQDVSSQTIFDVTKVASESLMNRSDVCESVDDIDLSMGLSIGMPTDAPAKTYTISIKNIPVKSTSTDAVFITSDGQHIFVGLNSASTTDYDLMVYDAQDISSPLDKVDSGPGLVGGALVGKNLFIINSSVNSVLQRFKFNLASKKLEKTGDYKVPWSSSGNPVYGTKISAIYPNLFLGLKKNSGEELLSIDLNKIDGGLASAINRKWELDSSVQDIWPMYDKYLHLLISTAKEPEINDFCLNCDFPPFSATAFSPVTTSPLNTFDLFGSLGNVRSLIAKDNAIYVGRTAGNSELFKINITRDYSSLSTPSISVATSASSTYSYDLINSIDVNDGIYSMVIANHELLLAEGKSNSKIQIRDEEDISKVIQTIDVGGAVYDMDCLGSKIFGVGSIYKMAGTSTESITPIIFELKPA